MSEDSGCLYDMEERRYKILQSLLRRKKNIPYLCGVFILLFCVLFLVCCSDVYMPTAYPTDAPTWLNPLDKYRVYSPSCSIRNIDAGEFGVELYKAQMKYHIDREPKVCTSLPLLSSVIRTDAGHTLHLHKDLLPLYRLSKRGDEQVVCRYSYIYSKDEVGNSTGDEPGWTAEKPFNDDIKLESTFDFVQVSCDLNSSSEPPVKNVYNNFHAFVSLNQDVRRKMELFDELVAFDKKYGKQKNDGMEDRLSVMIIGIDSMSQLNLMRTMPKTADYLKETGWLTLKGYNTVGENTLPNLAGAVLAGSTVEQLKNSCCPDGKSADVGPWIWKSFAYKGYITAYGEDLSRMDTFSQHGFTAPPTDYYLKPFLKAADQATSEDWFQKNVRYDDCLGPVHESEHVMNFSLEFVSTFSNYPTFSIFWLNSFSHELLFGAASKDEIIKNYLKKLMTSESLNKTILIFMSDHGMTRGFFRQTKLGFQEANMPFIYFWFPEKFKSDHFWKMENFVQNERRLTSHFDLHLTLLEILGEVDVAPGCPTCSSLFKVVPWDRSCADAGIPLRYCPCVHYVWQTNRTSYRHYGEQIVNQINNMIPRSRSSLLGGFQCSNFTLKSVSKVRKAEFPGFEGSTKKSILSQDTFVIVIETTPLALFEAMVFQNGTIDPGILRLDIYVEDSKCLLKGPGAPFCFCQPTSQLKKSIEKDLNFSLSTHQL